MRIGSSKVSLAALMALAVCCSEQLAHATPVHHRPVHHALARRYSGGFTLQEAKLYCYKEHPYGEQPQVNECINVLLTGKMPQQDTYTAPLSERIEADAAAARLATPGYYDAYGASLQAQAAADHAAAVYNTCQLQGKCL